MADRGSELTVAVTTTSGSLVGANPQRRALMISAPRSNRITVSTHNPAVLDQGITLQTGGAPVYLDERRVGTWLQQALFVVGAGSETIGLVEVICPCRDPAYPA